MKIGIITLYYESKNYGGVLQAYALAKYFCNHGHEAKQITFNNQRVSNHPKSLIEKLKAYGFWHCFKRLFQCPIEIFYKRKGRELEEKYKEEIGKRNLKFKNFREEIPHTNVFGNDTIAEIGNSFDCYVAGGDQVWNPQYWSPAYFFHFVKGKKKVSISASIGTEHYTDAEQEFVKALLADFTTITVREESAKRLLETTMGITAKVIIDPVMLLTAKEWEQIEEVSQEKVDINKPYLFCYFLGKEKALYKKAKKISRYLKIPIVYLSFINSPDYRERKFGDIKLYSVGPKEFLYLLRHSSYVVTDSFHGSVFSVLFHRPFWTMPRYDYRKIVSSDRIITFLNHLGIGDRFLSVKEERDWAADLNWDEVDRKLEKKIDEAKKYIDGMIE